MSEHHKQLLDSKSVEDWNAWRRLSFVVRPTLYRADLRDRCLAGIDLSGADLRECFLSNADLRAADLRNADLSGSDLQEADMRGALLDHSVLVGADLRDALLTGVRLKEADVAGVDFENAQGGVNEVWRARNVSSGWREKMGGTIYRRGARHSERTGLPSRRILRQYLSAEDEQRWDAPEAQTWREALLETVVGEASRADWIGMSCTVIGSGQSREDQSPYYTVSSRPHPVGSTPSWTCAVS